MVGIKINKYGLLYTLPCVGAYVGGDISSGVLAVRLDKAEALSLLIDIGTNGEIVLGNKDWMVCCCVGRSFFRRERHFLRYACGKGRYRKVNIRRITMLFVKQLAMPLRVESAVPGCWIVLQIWSEGELLTEREIFRKG